ncbi:hypothetical protein CPC08DRAFT_728110 [Agrocybe pediades]|nr:hypothetical protein CPC08DRAFT_728110 [Agrocybe pediades]
MYQRRRFNPSKILDYDYKTKPSNLQLLFEHRINPATLAYFFSRTASLAYILSSAVFSTAQVGDCPQLEKALCILFAFAVPSPALLFFFRLRAVFEGNRYVIGFFAFMWLSVLGASLTVAINGVTGINIGPTGYCLNAAMKNYVSSAAVLPLANDTLNFLAVSYRLMSNTHVDHTILIGVKTVVFGKYMPRFSRALLRDGQKYYLTTITASLLAVIMMCTPSVPIGYRTMFIYPNIVLMNIMACRIFRKTKLDFRNDTDTTFFGFTKSSNPPSENISEPTRNVIPLALRGAAHPGPGHGRTVGVSVTTEVDQDCDVADIEYGEAKNKERHSIV